MAKAQYLTKAAARIPTEKKTEIIERELDDIVKAHGSVSSEFLVELAKDPSHPLHRFFEWDDNIAGHKYRLVQATSMILAARFVCVIKNHQNSPPTVTAVSQGQRVQLRKLLPAYDGTHGFKQRPDVLSDKEARKHLIDRKLKALKSWCEGVIDLDELDSIRNTIESLLP